MTNDARQKLIEAREACTRFVITAKTGAIRARARGPVLGTVERDTSPGNYAYYMIAVSLDGQVSRVSMTRKGAADALLHALAADAAEKFLVDLLERDAGLVGAIREAIATPWRDDPNALGGLCYEIDLERAMQTVATNRSVREAA